jgi:hypothetical protein
MFDVALLSRRRRRVRLTALAARNLAPRNAEHTVCLGQCRDGASNLLGSRSLGVWRLEHRTDWLGCRERRRIAVAHPVHRPKAYWGRSALPIMSARSGTGLATVLQSSERHAVAIALNARELCPLLSFYLRG